MGVLDFLHQLVFIKRGSDQQSTGKSQDKEIENRQAKNILSDTLKKLDDLEQKKVPEDLDQGKSIGSKDSKTAKNIEEQYPDFFDEDSGNSGNKKQAYSELKEYLQGELKTIPDTKDSVPEGSVDRDTKKPKPSTSDSSEALASNPEDKEKASSSETKNKGSLIDDFANPNDEFGD